MIGLAREPADCVDAFASFIFQQIMTCDYLIESEEKAKVLVHFQFFFIILDKSLAQDSFFHLISSNFVDCYDRLSDLSWWQQ